MLKINGLCLLLVNTLKQTIFTYIVTLEPFIRNTRDTIQIHISSRGLLNKIQAHSINRPSFVLSDHVDTIYQIRHMLQNANINIELVYNEAVRPLSEIPSTPLETLMFKMHCGSTTYFRNKPIKSLPTENTIPFPAQQICIIYKHQPIVTNIDDFLQESERKQDRSEYFF